MNYENYSIEDFLQNEEFKRWVKNPDPESDIFWNNWLRSHPDQKEAILKAREILLTLDFQVAEPDKDDYEEVLLNILKGDATRSVSERKIGTQANYFTKMNEKMIRLAGVFLILMVTLAVYFYLREDPAVVEEAAVRFVTKENPRGQKSQISLPDGTVLWLNSESSITYPEKFKHGQRLVTLKGEAFFEVAKEQKRPFVVQINDLDVVALGTSFNIRAFPENQNVAVSLVTGRVLIKENISSTGINAPHFEDLILIPGEKILYDLQDFSIEKSYYDLKTDIAWKNGTIYFDNASYQEVKAKLERWFNVEFKLKNKSDKKWNYSGEFTGESLDRILARIGFVEGFEFEKKDNEIIIIYSD
ncbi:FecR domain-containing protein [Fulvivirgaceae bacterium BMA12]|uniref:FecR domain-containing protein n=1 Tax=Agaribacillus aureus TaxID=3051825 RepID=A0ABT8L0N8_9BACT|nr:FecR domain-containing protein [Fulvivirgaceae bacterium BMA12]